MTRPLLIGPDERAKIGVALAMARANPVSREYLERFAFGDDCTELNFEDRPPGLERPPSQPVFLPTGYWAAISFEDQPAGLVRHLSVSVDAPGKLPNLHALSMIADAFGLKAGKPSRTWLEEFDPGHSAINLIQLDEDCEP